MKRISVLLTAALVMALLASCTAGGHRLQPFPAMTTSVDAPPSRSVGAPATVTTGIPGADRPGVTGPGPSSATASTAPQSGRPNIIYILTDDLSQNLVQFMPHVRQMQVDGVTFSHYFVADTLCCPSRATILTGEYPHNTGVFTNGGDNGGFDVFHQRGDQQRTFGVALQRAGYRTGLMGKYLNYYEPTAMLGGDRPYVPPGWDEWDVAGWGYPEFDYDLNENGTVVHYGKTPDDYLTDVLAGKAIDFIDGAASDGRPFALEVATFAPHQPATPAPRDKTLFQTLAAPRLPSFDKQPRNVAPWLAIVPPLSAANIDQITTLYRKRAASVQAVDAMIGSIRAELARKGLLDNTYIVFNSDNGFHLGEHRLRPGKQTAFDTDVNVPLVVTGPGVPAGRTIDQIASNVDIAPTFEDLAGAPIPVTVDGRSLLPLLHGKAAPDWRHAALIEHRGPDKTQGGDPDKPQKYGGDPPSYDAIRTPHEIYVRYFNGQQEFYDLAGDPYEMDNIIASVSPERLEAFRRALTGLANCHGTSSCHAADRSP